MKQYSKRTALMHWVIFVLIVIAFYLGHEVAESKDAAGKLAMYPAHFLIGDLILLLTLVRIWFRKKDEPYGSNFMGDKAGQNTPDRDVNLSSLPYDPFTPF